MRRPMQNNRPRVRDLGIVPGLLPTGRFNAITDVPGVRVGHVTLIRGKPGPRVLGKGPVRTGVTVIVPGPGNIFRNKFCAAVETINGYGKATGFEQIREMGTLETPIALTNTLSVPTAAAALVEYTLRRNPGARSVNAVVGECNDGALNDIAGRHVKTRHILRALDLARGGPLEEGNVGAGVGMGAFGFKAGIGTASRRVAQAHGGFNVGVLVNTNSGSPPYFRIAGLPVGAELLLEEAVRQGRWRGRLPSAEPASDGSIMIVLATDAPVNERKLGRMARRVVHGLARAGLTSTSGSGDFVIAFTTANRGQPNPRVTRLIRELNEDHISALFGAVIEATEEAYLNSVLRCKTLGGCDGLVRAAVPVEKLKRFIKRAGTFLSYAPGRPRGLPGP